MARPKNVQDFLDKYWWSARVVSQQAGVFTSIMLAQAGLESQWGTKTGGAASIFFGNQVLTYCKKQAVLQTVQSGQSQRGGFCIYANFVEAAQGWVSLIDNAPQFKPVRDNKRNYERFIDTLSVAYNATGLERPVPNETKEQRAARMQRAHAAYAATLRGLIGGFLLKEYDAIFSGSLLSVADTAGKSAIKLLSSSPPDYMGAIRGLWNGWMKDLVNNSLPEVEKEGKLKPLLDKIDEQGNVQRLMLQEKGDGLHRIVIAMRAVRLKTENSAVTVQNLESSLGDAEKRVLNALPSDQRQDLEEFFRRGPTPF